MFNHITCDVQSTIYFYLAHALLSVGHAITGAFVIFIYLVHLCIKAVLLRNSNNNLLFTLRHIIGDEDKRFAGNKA